MWSACMYNLQASKDATGRLQKALFSLTLPGNDGHYLPFEDVYGTATTEEHRPRMRTQNSRQKSLPFTASVQHVKNANMMMQCEE